MSAQLKIELTPEAEAIVRSQQTLPTRVINYIAAAMDQSNQRAIRVIQAQHLTGKGPFPVAEHRLGVVTNRLRGSVWASGAQEIAPGNVQSAIGSNVVYAALHEFGGRVHHEPRQMKVRHRLDASGGLIKQLANSNLLMFARASHKRVRETTVTAKAYDVNIPERAPFRTGLQESMPIYKQNISAAIIEAWNSLKN